MTPAIGFVLFLIITLGLLGCVVRTGQLGLRRRHITLVVMTVISLGITIYYAEALGDGERARYWIGRASSSQYGQRAQGDFMTAVARVRSEP